MKVWALCISFDELLNNLHHSLMKVSTIRIRPPHVTVVVTGVHRKCAVDIQDTHIKTMYAGCRGYSQECALLRLVWHEL